MQKQITLTAVSPYGGAAIVEISEDGARLISDDRKYQIGYLSFISRRPTKRPTERLQAQLAAYWSHHHASMPGFCLPVCRWAFEGFDPQTLSEKYLAGKCPVLNG